MRPLLGTYVEIGTFHWNSGPPIDLGPAFEAVSLVHKLLSFHDPTSDLSKLNASAGEEIILHPLSARVLRLAKAISRASRNLFNPTIGGKLQELGVLPVHQGVRPSVPFGSADDIQITGLRVSLRKPIAVVLDGIAKGFAADCAIETLKRQGLQNGWVNAGGDIRVYGNLTLPVQILGENDRPIGMLGLRNAAIATSRVEAKPSMDHPGWIVSADGNRPTCGVWSALAETCWRADALTKVLSLAPADRREALMHHLGGQWVQGPQAALS